MGQVERGLEQTHKEIAYRPEPVEAQGNDNKVRETCTVFSAPILDFAHTSRFPAICAIRRWPCCGPIPKV